MTDAEELAVLREFAEKAAGNWHCLGDLYLGTTLQNNWIARRIADSPTRGISYGEDSILAEGKSPAKCILAARAKLQAERDAKDAPKLREERDKSKAALEEIGGHKFWDGPYFQRVAREALKETP